MAGFETLIGQTISHYRIIEKLGSGGMGAVYKAEETPSISLPLNFLPEDLAQTARLWCDSRFPFVLSEILSSGGCDGE